MSRDSTVIRLRQPDAVDDPLTDLAREGARRMLANPPSASVSASLMASPLEHRQLGQRRQIHIHAARRR